MGLFAWQTFFVTVSESMPDEYRIDTTKYVDYYYKVYLVQTFVCCGYPNLLCLPCTVANLRDFADAVTVRLTTQNLIYTREKVPTCWRLSCCDQGRTEKTIPLDKITDVALIEPAGGCPPQTLFTLKIQTASRSGAIGAELSVTGLPEAKARELQSRLQRESGRRSGVRPVVMRRG